MTKPRGTDLRNGFPIASAGEGRQSRRQFGVAVVTAAGCVVGARWIGQSTLTTCAVEVPLGIRLSELQLGEARVFHYPGPDAPCLLYRLSPKPDDVVAYSQACTHLRCPVVPRLAERQLLCPCHNGAFDAATGKPLRGPAEQPLARIALRFDEDGQIIATGLA